ncbi:MAG: hypothetical protein ACRCZM_11925 [Bacteroidales bacterium]
MIRKLYLPFLMAILVAFTACSKKMGPLSADMFKVTPSPLELKGGKVNATIDGQFPEKYFNKKSEVTVTPVLVYGGKESKSTSVTFQGEKVKGNNNTIAYKAGGKYSMPASFTYVPEMRNSELYLEFSVVRGAKSYKLPRLKVAEGVISTELMSSAAAAKPAIAADKFQRIIKEAYQAQILFLIQQANLRASELKSEQLAQLHTDIKAAAAAPNKEITGIEISSYASPDGALDLNERLAGQREKNTQSYLAKELKKSKVEANIEGKFTAEDWDGFKELMEKSNIQDKELVLRVLSMYNDPEQREREIKNMSSVFKNIADEVLPQLRRSRLTASINVIGKSDEEIANLAKNDNKALNVEELLYAATLPGADRAAIYTAAMNNFPQDFRGFNNMGVVEYEKGNFNAAADLFAKSAKINNSPEANMNLGMIAMVNGDLATAEQCFGKAAGAEGLNDALGILYTHKGDYSAAVRSFGESKTIHAAVAQILSKDYNKAKTTLSAIEKPCAGTYYLMAVVGARTNNESMVINNVREAVKANASMAKLAATDLEFAKFFGNSEFNNIVK